METTNKYEVSEKDFKDLESIFSVALNNSLLLTMGNDELQEELELFIMAVGGNVKTILQKYATDNKIKQLEVESHQESMMSMKRKMVKMQLKFKQIENAINSFNKVRKET